MHSLLRRSGISVNTYADLKALAEAALTPAGAIILSDIAVSSPDIDELVHVLTTQPQWSDVPIVLLCRADRRQSLEVLLATLKNVTVIDRPTTTQTLLSSVQAALRARERQYQLRDQIKALEDSERKVRERERELQTITENIPDILSRFDRLHRHVYVNKAATHLTGIAEAEFLGRTNRELGMPDELCSLWEAAVSSVFEVGEVQTVAFEFEHSAGTTYFENTLVPEINEYGEVETVLCVGHDRTKTRRAELALQLSNRRKDEFLAMLAHELRNPLAPIKNASEILIAMENMDGHLSRLAHIIRRQASQMTRLVDDLLDVSRITEGLIELQRATVSIKEIVTQAIESVQPLVRERGHALELDMAEDALHVDGDFARLVQCVSNVLTNAAKYTDRGGRITLRTQASEERVVLSVSDNGAGIPEEMLSAIFEPFVQCDRSMDRSLGGLGVGLAVVKRLIEMHDGTVGVRSDGLGCGAQFDITLPVVAPPGERRQDVNVSGVSSKTVLVVDDNKDAADTLASLLQLAGHAAHAVYGAREAIALAHTLKPDVILLDLGLPVMDGYEVAAQLRRARLGKKIVAVTGYGQEADIRRSMAAGFDDHVVKPVDYSALCSVVG